MATEEVHQLLIDSFSVYGKLKDGGPKWAFDATHIGRLYVSILYGLKNNNINEEDYLTLKELNKTISKKWQESN